MTRILSKIMRVAVVTCGLSASQAAIVINEFQYDDTGASDDREFVELFNNGDSDVEIGGWTIGRSDAGGAKAPIPIPTGTTLTPGAFWVIGQSAVPNVNQVIGATFENDNETIELYDSAATLVDAVLYEGNKGASFVAGGSPLALQIGNSWGHFGNHQGVDSAPGRTLTTIGRHLDGRDTNNNGRDFGLRPSTPGASNHAAGILTRYEAPDVESLSDGTLVGGLTGSFVGARVITPTFTTPGLNPNAIPAPAGATKAIIAWDNAGGGNATVSDQVYANGGSFQIQVYLDTTDLPMNTNASGQSTGRGAEETFYGIGTIDAFVNFADVGGTTGLLSGDIGPNGAAGVHWYYEKVGESSIGAGDVSEKLYLVDAGDMGPNNADGPMGFDWTILATIDLSTTASGWFNLGLFIAPDGSGVGMFNDQFFPFTTQAGLVGEFTIGYRENTTEFGAGVPSYIRPPTFAVPEPGTAALLGIAGMTLLRRRRSF